MDSVAVRGQFEVRQALRSKDHLKGLFTKAAEDNAQAVENEYLHPSHANQILQAVDHVGRGTIILSELLRLAAGQRREGDTTTPVQNQEGLSEVARLAAERAGIDQGASPPPSSELARRGKTLDASGDIRISLEALRAFDIWGESLKQACAEIFATILATTKPPKFPQDSAAWCSAKDLVDVCIEGAREIVDKKLESRISKPWRPEVR